MQIQNVNHPLDASLHTSSMIHAPPSSTQKMGQRERASKVRIEHVRYSSYSPYNPIIYPDPERGSSPSVEENKTNIEIPNYNNPT